MAISAIGTPTTGTSGASTATSLSINLASTTVGAFNVIGLSINSTGAAGDPIPTVPTGWSVIGEKSKTGSPWHHLIVIGKFYQSGDSTSLTLNWSLTGNGSAGCAAYSGVDTTTPVISGEVLAQSQPASSTSWNTGNITTAGSRWICAALANRTSGTWSALTDTQRYTQITASSANIVYEDSNGTVAVGTYNRTATYSAATSVGNTVIFALNPASGGAVNYTANPTDSVGITDSVSITLSGNPSISESIGITDSVSYSKTTPVSVWLTQTTHLYVAHRGGDNDWPEMTMFAYGQADKFGSTLALNVDGWQTSDGVWVASHDQNTSRVFGTSMDIPTSTWAQLSGLTTTNGGYPICRVQDVLAAYASTHVIFAENKHASSLDSSWFSLLDAYGGSSNIVVKQYYTASTVASDAHTRGYTTWGYYYAADLTNLASTQANWDILGLDYTDTSSSDWTTIKSYGKKVLGHVIPSVAGAAQAFSEGADGIMTGKVLGVVPGGIGDPVGITDTISTSIGFNRSLADPVGINDAITMVSGNFRSFTESISLTDIVSTTVNYVININESVGITDSVSATISSVNTANVSDPVGITDNVSTLINSLRSTTESVGITDAIQTILNNIRIQTDPVGITDIVTFAINYNVTINENIGINDSTSANKSGALSSNLTEAITISDFVTYTLSRSIVVVLPANPNIGGQSFDYARIKAVPGVSARPANPVLGGESFDYDK